MDIFLRTRGDFPILSQEIHGKPLIYFDNAASSQKPRSVVDTLVNYYETSHANVHRGVHELSNRATEAYEKARARAALFLHAERAEEIIFTRGTTEGINLVASTWGAANLKESDVVLLTEMEHHSNIVPWLMLKERLGIQLRYIPVDPEKGTLDLTDLGQLLEGVKLLSMVHVSNTPGTINPVKELCTAARERNIITLVDAAQSAGHMLLDVQEIGCDFLALSGHKMCGPTGIGVLYGRFALLETMPPYQGGGEMIETVDFDSVVYNVAPHKFEAGTPNIADAVGLAAAMDYLDDLGRGRIYEHDLMLAQYARERFGALEGVRILGPATERAGVLSFLFKDLHALDLVSFADRKGLALRAGHHCNQPLMKKLGTDATARASFYFYNTVNEVDQAVEIIEGVRRKLLG